MPLLIILLLALLGYCIWANGAVVTTEYELDAGLDGELVIAQVSDLHNAVFGRGNEKLLAQLRAAEPDVIVFTGDTVDSRRTDVDAAAELIAAAAEISPVYCVTGNHEARIDFGAVEERLESAGAVYLRNEAVSLGGVTLAGIDDPAFVKSGGTAAERAESLLEKLPETEGFTVLLAHRPELAETYVETGVSLVLSGHAHGGQIRLPFIGGLYAPTQGFFPEYDAGLYELGDTAMIVSRGLGNSLFPLRINNRPELVVISIK